MEANQDNDRLALSPEVSSEDDGLDVESGGWFDSDFVAISTSFLLHLGIVLGLALMPSFQQADDEAVVLVSPPPDYDDQSLREVDQFVYSELPQTEIGAAGAAEQAMASASAPEFSEVAEIPNPMEVMPQELASINVNNMFAAAVAPIDLGIKVKGKVGQATEGATGAVDRLTFEILKSLEERPTLIVWLFDQSGSLTRQRAEIRDRFDRIYEELGIFQNSQSEAFRSEDGEPALLTSIMGFGEGVHLLTEEPLADVDRIKATVDSIESDPSGVERVFSAVFAAANQYKDLRRSRASSGPRRNVILVVVTDERGDDAAGLEATIDVCKKYGMPVYVIGVPAPFGRENTLIKYVDPDPQFDQTPQFAQVDQGPESLLPERVQIGYIGNFRDEPVLDSGFGPFALTRLSYETGGIFFTVHPNRDVHRRVRESELSPFASAIEYFFDPNVMSRYRPDYVSPRDYEKSVQRSPLRSALIAAARFPAVAALDTPQLRFIKVDEARLVGELSRAQQAAARIEPRLIAIDELLRQGEEGRKKETSARWLAGFDLARGRVLAHKVRAETYNAMLARAKRGMPFSDPKNNTWLLRPADEVSVGSKWEREAKEAAELLQKVVDNHPGTPWALLAKEELRVPIGWKWEEEYTNLDPPRPASPGDNNNNPAPAPADDAARMIERKPTRPVPKL